MRYSRKGIIAVLAAAEIFLGGAILWALGKGSFVVHASQLPHASTALPGKPFPGIDAGSAPHVVVNDPDDGIVISPSSDGKVHVADLSEERGLYIGSGGSPKALQVAKTADGVSVTRPQSEGGLHLEILGFSRRRVEMQVPADAALDIVRCSGAEITGLTGRIAVHSVDGHIALRGVHASALTLRSDDGHLQLDDVSAPSIDARTADGAIRASGLRVGAGALRSNDGSIRVELISSNLTVHARTADGSVRFNGRRSSSGEFRIGSGSGTLEVATQDGSIHITSNGAH